MFVLCFSTDMESFEKPVKTILFADGAHPYSFEKRRKSCLSRWFQNNALRLNMEKTRMVCFRSGIRSIRTERQNTPIPVSNSVKFQGVFLDQNLNNDAHIEYLLKKTVKNDLYLLQTSKYCYTGSANESVLRIYTRQHQ